MEIARLARYSPLGYNMLRFPVAPSFPWRKLLSLHQVLLSKTRLDETEVVRQLLNEAELSRDQLPYTEEFGAAQEEIRASCSHAAHRRRVLAAHHHVGKRGGLARPKSRKMTVPSPRLTTEQQLELLRLFPDGIGNRDQLPYTDRFDALHRQFNKLIRANLDSASFGGCCLALGSARASHGLFSTRRR